MEHSEDAYESEDNYTPSEHESEEEDFIPTKRSHPRKRKDPTAVRHSAFPLFQVEMRQEIINSIPKKERVGGHWFIKAASAMWKGLSDEERQHYKDRVVGCVTGYNMFMTEMSQEYKKNHEWEWGKSQSIIGQQWSKLNEKERQEYGIRANEANKKKMSDFAPPAKKKAVDQSEKQPKQKKIETNLDKSANEVTQDLKNMNCLIQARLSDLISTEEYNQVKQFILTEKAQEPEVSILMDLMQQCIGEEGVTKWQEEKGSELLAGVVKIFSI
jgi:hypothetical protein